MTTTTTTTKTTAMTAIAIWCVAAVMGAAGGLVLDGTYGQFRKWNAGVNGTLEMEFKTRSPNGLLMYTDDGGTYDFFELKMVEGTMRLRYNLGAGAQILMAGHDLYDGRWHRTAVERRGRVTTLTVDNATSAAASAGKELQFGRLASNSAVYVGGMPGWYNGRLTRLALPSVIFEPRFSGAVRNVVYTDEFYPYPRRQTAITDPARQPKCTGTRCRRTLNRDIWFMGSVWPITIVVISYLYFVLKGGPEFMKFRNPYNIDRIVMIYNAVQVLFSTYLVKEAFRLVWLRDDYRFYCFETSKEDPDIARQQVYTVWLFLASRFLDLLDTVFFILRKKQSQVTFLHVYHHTLVITFGWSLTNFYPGGQVAFFGTINGIVHVIMYSYYFLTIINPEYKKAWWKKYLTTLQLVQFVITGLHAFITLFEPDCNFPRIIMLLAIPQDIFMFILFWDFYKKAYIKPKKIKQ